MLMGVSAGGGSNPGVSSAAGRCQCVDDLLAPIRSKMKVLKKFKKRMGLAARSGGGGGGTNNLPPLLFHQVHGDNIRLSRDGAVARRAESFCKGVTFSSRPVKVAEKVCVKFLEVSNNWSGVIRFGFTCNDPSNLRCGLPKYVCPDLTNKPGYWAKALAERFAEPDTVLFYYVTPAGDVHFGINGEEKGVFFGGVETKGPLWAVLDVYGNSTAVELVDPRQQLNNSRSGGGDAVDRCVVPSLTQLSLHEAAAPGDLPPPRYQQGAALAPLPFHRTRGRSIRLSNDRCIASRIDVDFCHGYVFTARPVQLGEKIVIQVLATEAAYTGALAFGVTSCDPATLQASELPDDSDSLVDRPEYWVVASSVAGEPRRGDELSFCVTQNGEVQFSKNGSVPAVFMHVDHSLQLWAFLDVYGSTQKVRILGSTTEQAQPAPSASGSRNSSPPPRTADPALTAVSRLRVNLPCPSSPSGTPEMPPQARFCCAGPVPPPPAATATAELVQYQGGAGGGTVLVVNLPPAQANYLNQHQAGAHHHPSPPPHARPLEAASSGTLMSTYSHTYIEPISTTSYSTLDSTATMQQWVDAAACAGAGGADCTICYERPIDSVLYMCGHMCMCYDCAVQQWRGKGGGHCPLCRAVIRDVIRTYKS
ncbi:LOW QUALITY PROTEIN: protein neuralized [Bacillus rossius redtenbacheri]|uniref:LOW QUALITY PROTEIN: protein neuralized n=1 Tax=Bacillus rossius redtenbacheri TaxID=93214 RepID=UPI002FDE7CE7